ncbi:MAG TPA: bifunctional precorrin-2 dehydrogenase/sirohydrochlorin ferrochelatase [Candidatus Binatia bacterium]
MTYFPISLEMTGRPCLVIGGGAVAERKIANLLEAGAEVTVISPEVTAAIARWEKHHELTLTARKFQDGDLAGFQIVFVATNDRDVNDAVYREGKSRGAWVNAADDPAHCDFILPSVLRRGDLTVAVSSGGASPALSRAIREELEVYFTPEYELLAKLAAEIREDLRRRSMAVPFETWRQALSGDVRRLLMRGELARAKSHLLRALGVLR